MRNAKLGSILILVIAFVIAGAYVDAGNVDIESTVDRGGGTPSAIAKQTLTPSWAGDDGYISHRDVTALKPMTAAEAWAMRQGADGVIHLTPVPLGTCDSLVDCAAHASDTCEDLDYGDATHAEIDTDDDSCRYTCANGISGIVSCA